jgi:hypothetical protein
LRKKYGGILKVKVRVIVRRIASEQIGAVRNLEPWGQALG